MRNIRLDLEYDGRNYSGWQWQPNAPSIEAEIKKAIETMVRHKIVPYSSGRTDAGVHAEQHVMQFFSETQLTALELLRGLNSLLPEDIAVYRVLDMPREWSARHDPLWRQYRYTFFNSAVPSALWRHRAYWMRFEMHTGAMRQAADYFIGEHNFNAFRSVHCPASNPVRRILSVEIEETQPLIHLHIRGHAFLRHQVRIMAGTLLDAALGKIAPDAIAEILRSQDRSQAGTTLPAHGLTLTQILYPGDEARFFGPGALPAGRRAYANGPVHIQWKPSERGKTGEHTHPTP